MKVWDIVKAVGSTALNVALPGVGTAVVGLVNEFLPDDKKLPKDATGRDVEKAMLDLPPADRARIMEKQFDVEITDIKQSNETIRAMLEADAKSMHTTRPYIAKGAFQVVAFCICSIIVIWSYGVVVGDTLMVKSVTEGWPFILAVIAPLVTLLYAYFGVLKRENKDRLDAIGGRPPGGLLGTVLSAFKK